MKKLYFFMVIAVMAIMTACGSGVDKEKVNELLNKETKDLTSDDIVALLDNLDALIDDVSSADPKKPSDKDKENASLMEKIEEKITDWGELQEAQGKEVPENVTKKAQEVFNHAAKVMEEMQKKMN